MNTKNNAQVQTNILETHGRLYSHVSSGFQTIISYFSCLSLAFLSLILLGSCDKPSDDDSTSASYGSEELDKYPKIVLGGGCFWCTQSALKKTLGVVATFSGYAYEKNATGADATPTYESVSSGSTKAREAVMVYYDPELIYLEKILDVYWRHIDPTDVGGQFADRGHHYTTAIYFGDSEQEEIIRKSKAQIAKLPEIKKRTGSENIVATEILDFDRHRFAVAKEYHQNYDEKNPSHYKKYFRGSGREGFIKSFWKKITQEKTLPNSSSLEKSKKNEVVKLNEQKKVWETTNLSLSEEEKQQQIAQLDELSKYVTQHDGTEQPYKNKYWDRKEDGIYVDIVSGEPLFSSRDKYDSGTGWPSFTKPLEKSSLSSRADYKLGMPRTEVRSKVGDSHLGHIFPDGPKEQGGMRYCINSAALRFVKKAHMKAEGYAEYLPLFD